VSADEQGAVAGLTGGAGAAGFIFAPLIGNALYSWSNVAPYWLATVLLTFLFLYVASNTRIKSAVIQTFDESSSPGPPA
jgi:nitrate/nitrite transporter NarK